MKSFKAAAMVMALFAAVAFVPGKADASDTSDVMTAINSAVASFNKGDGKAWAALCTSPASIVSNIAPFQYYGSTACADWWSAHAASSKKNGFSDETVTLGTAWHVVVSGDRAYAALPANYAYRQKGKAMKTSGILTIALRKTSGGWLMTGWSWAAR